MNDIAQSEDIKIMFLKNANYAYELEKFDEAKNFLDSITDPNYYNYHFLYGKIFLKEKNMEEAKKHFNECLRIDKTNYMAYLKLMDIYMKTNDLQEAQRNVEIAEKYVKNEKEKQNCLKFKGSLQNKLKRYDDAIKTFDQLLKTNLDENEKIKYEIYRAKIYVKLADFEKAEKIMKPLKRKREMRKEIKKLYVSELLLLKIAKGKLDEAEDIAFGASLESAFTGMFYGKIYWQVFLLYKCGKYDKILEVAKDIVNWYNERNIEKIREIKEDYGFYILFFIGVTHRVFNDLDKFIEIMEVFRTNLPNKYDSEYYQVEMAKYYFQTNQRDKGIRAIDNALRINIYCVDALKLKIAFYNSNSEKDQKEIDKILNENQNLINNYEKNIAESDIGQSIKIIEHDEQVNPDLISLNFDSIFSSSTQQSPPEPIYNPNPVPDNSKKKKLGGGGQGTVQLEEIDGHVYACKYFILDNKLQNKELTQEQKEEELREKKQMLKKEIERMYELDHINIIKLEGFLGEKLLMEYAEGGDTLKLINDLKRIENNENKETFLKLKLNICKGVAEGLKYLHNHKIIHSDMKPENILLDKKYNPNLPNEFPSAKICDFGFSLLLSEIQGLTKSQLRSQLGGTLNYCPPEIINDDDIIWNIDYITVPIYAKFNDVSDMGSISPCQIISSTNETKFTF